MIKPFITNKTKSNSHTITLFENDTLVTNPVEVTNIFNEYFINVAQDPKEPDNVNNMSTDEVIDRYRHDPSIKLINHQVNSLISRL